MVRTLAAGAAYLRTLCSVALTMRRLVHRAQRSMLRFKAYSSAHHSQAGLDAKMQAAMVCTRYPSCPIVVKAIGSQKDRPPAWAEDNADPLRVLLLVRCPPPEADVVLTDGQQCPNAEEALLAACPQVDTIKSFRV